MRLVLSMIAMTAVLVATPALAAYEDGANMNGSMNSAAAAQFDQRIDQLEQQVRELTGIVERNQYQNAQLKNQLERMSSDIELRFDQMRQQQAAAPAPTPQVAAPIVDNSIGAGDSPKTRAAAQAAAASPEAAQAVYDDAFAKLRAADYAGAERGFNTYLKSGDTKLAGNAQYWLGETYYVRGQYKEAAVAFAEGYQKYPKNTKAPDNLLKLAMSLGQLGSKDDACLTLGELKKNYPNAAPTIRSRADQEKSRLGCKG